MLAAPHRIPIASDPATQAVLPARSERGFTLMELVTIMIVIGILAVVALPKFSLLSGFNDVGYRDKVKAALEFARKSAVAQRRYACVVISGNDATLTIESVMPENHAGNCPYTRQLTLPASDSNCSGGVANMVCHPNNVTLTAGTIMFDAQGRPLAGAGSYTVDGTAAGGSTWTITVEAETGYVHSS